MVELYPRSFVFDKKSHFKYQEYEVVSRHGMKKDRRHAILRHVMTRAYYVYFYQKHPERNVAGKVAGRFTTRRDAASFARSRSFVKEL